MINITLKNVPDKIHKELKQRATLHHRSLNSEILFSLEKALGWEHKESKNLLLEARKIRNRIKKSVFLTDKDLAKFKNAGRK